MAAITIQGYSLFNEVEDKEVQVFNRARVMKNMMQDHSDAERNVNAKGVSLIYQYFEAIPMEDRQLVHTKLAELLREKDSV